ncbi:MAG: 23S rRNA (adenine(2503)-C(2))-methyltransferase RlmN [Alphaproteobacteria bacterium]|nr:23S rRNA (adenine(2503)-C(2))-methyltransferase RlmN [Alphaproteobacteria bacterium]
MSDPAAEPAAEPVTAVARTDLLALSRDELTAWLRDHGQPAFRGKQLWAWLWDKGAADFDEMTDLPKGLRQVLHEQACIGTLTRTIEQQSQDGTRKRLYALADGKAVESVLMPYNDGRRTACISTQAGCAMGCVFCATGQMGFQRHLTATEIVEQAWRFDQELKAEGGRLSNVVLMGMGEPFHNYDNALAAIRRLNQDLGIGARHITVSTVGLVPAIRRFAQEGIQVTLAISLHAATDAQRSALLPVNKRWGVDEVVAACRDYVDATHRRVTFEWALIAGENDTPDEAHRLGRLLRGLTCHVNLIPLNPTKGYGGAPTAEPDAAAFVEVLGRYGVPATVRVRRGIDIDAGCGQLRERADAEATQ